MTKRSGKQILASIAVLCILCACASPPRKLNSPDQLDKPYLVLISIDGFRWDYSDLFPTPAIDQLVARGVRSEALIPVFPTQTFPNHYSIVTGLYPEHHGIVANQFRDRDTGEWYNYKLSANAQDGAWYGGEPIWVAAEKAGMLSAAYFFVGSEADIQGIRPTHWRAFEKGVSGSARINQVLKWLDEPPDSRPHLYTVYFEDVDDHGHWYGPLSKENAGAVKRVDETIQLLLDGLAELPHGNQVNVVLVSDHGQAAYKKDIAPFILSEHFNLTGTNPIDGGPATFLYFDQPDRERAIGLRDGINQVWNCGNAYLPEDAPPEWRINDNPRFADVFIIADPGCSVLSSSDENSKITMGDHGWPPEAPEMRGIFMAAGPDLPAGLEIGPVRAVDIYPLLMKMLELEPATDVDSDPEALKSLLD